MRIKINNWSPMGLENMFRQGGNLSIFLCNVYVYDVCAQLNNCQFGCRLIEYS